MDLQIFTLTFYDATNRIIGATRWVAASIPLFEEFKTNKLFYVEDAVRVDITCNEYVGVTSYDLLVALPHRPKLGSRVYYIPYVENTNRLRRAAIITQVHPFEFGADGFKVDLCVLNPTGMEFIQDVFYGSNQKHWSFDEFSTYIGS